LSPDIQKVAKALAGKDRLRLQPDGAYASNLLGLSDQVPAKAVIHTNGRSRTVKIGRQEIQLRRTTPRNMAAAGRLTGLLTQALRHLGRTHITPAHLAHLKRTLPAKERQRLLKDLSLAPAWMHPLFRELAERNQAELEGDYGAMRDMFIAPLPSFDSVLQTVSELECRINALPASGVTLRNSPTLRK